MGPVAALAAELNHPGLRATALSVVTLVYNLLGLAPGPLVVGALSDAFGLRQAMMVIPVVCFGAAICFLLGSRPLPEDLRRFQSVEKSWTQPKGAVCLTSEETMHFMDDSLLPENQEKLVIQVAPYGPEWFPEDSDDIPVTMDEQVQKAVDCYNAGATVLHVHVRELDGKGSKRLSMFNEMLARLRQAVPEMILQVGGSISFAPEGEGAEAKWLNDDTRHMLAELDPKPDQVTIAINTNQMNVTELLTEEDIAGTSMATSGLLRSLP